MGWDTEITIIAENIDNRNDIKKLKELIYEKDGKSYEMNSSFEKDTNTLYYHYQRRKYAPYWVIQEISKTYPKINFTILASCPEFIGGPAGIIRICNGEILDSYGIENSEEFMIRKLLVAQSLKYIPLVYDWYKFDGTEEQLRLKHVPQYPKNWCDGNYIDKVIPITETKELKDQLKIDYSNLNVYNWKEI
ncbi:hypothetical protein [uncultured Tenacibaculum sp.]|uniref:hypothetical protein n=2 Tax=uncultured Tenacibaculum sp. TaxID=174713 RepID=UPI00262585FE|nr:hypothetical protein [uncultured Tenacibaculum sp.]